MSFENLIEWTKNPSLLNRDSLLQLKALVDEYPCFAVARILYLKNLLVLGDQRFSKELVLTALSVPDRRRLYYFIEDKPMPQATYSHEKELTAGEGFSIIDRFLHLSATDTETPEAEPADLPLSESGRDENERDVLDKQVDLSGLTEPDFVLPQQESSFSLDYISFLSQTSPEVEEENLSMPGLDLIDAFLNQSPESGSKSVPMEDEKPVKEAVKMDPMVEHPEEMEFNVDLPEDTFTETLAKIYLKQKRYDHALEIFKSLSLKYPEKNVYFADQIRYLEKLIINIKNN
jgi:hypothetical protein